MPRKSEIQAEETATNSPLRRSSRINVTPATLSATKNLQSAIEASEVKGVKTRRASLSQENTDKDEKKENKPVPRGRRGSTARDETEQKPEPSKVRTRRSSANTEPAPKVEDKKSAESETPRQLRSRRSSVTDKPTEENTEKVNVKGKKTVTKEDSVNEDAVKKPIRSRRNSNTDKSEETPIVEEKERKRPTRGRRASTEKLEDEPEPKSSRLTPSKSKRRLSVTDIANNLEPITEQEPETHDRKTGLPVNTDLKVVLNTLSPNNETSKENKRPSSETRSIRLTPVKSRRRLSVTENAVNLEPIEEQELETKGRNSKSPTQTELTVVLSPVLTETEVNVENTEPEVESALVTPDPQSRKPLSITERESDSLPIEEKLIEMKNTSPSKNNKENAIATSLNNEELSEIEVDVDKTEESTKTESPISVVENDGNFVLKEEQPDTIKVDDSSLESELTINHPLSKKGQPTEVKSNSDLSVIEERSFVGESPDNDKPNRRSPKQSPKLHKKVKSPPETPRKSPRLMKHIAMAEEKNDTEDIKIDDSVKMEIGNDTCNVIDENEDNGTTPNDYGKGINRSSNDLNAATIPCGNEPIEMTKHIESDASGDLEYDLKNEIDADPSTKTDGPHMSPGSDGSFRFHLNISLPSTNSEHTSQKEGIDEADEINTSKGSNTSDKENIEVQITSKRVERKLMQITDTNADNSMNEKPQEVIVARVSNVFRPKMKEISFVEPMEVDEYSYIQDTTINNLPNEQDKSNIENVSPAKSTPILTRKSTQFKKHENETRKQSINEGDSVDESFKLNLSISNVGEEKLDVDSIKDESIADSECIDDPQVQNEIEVEDTDEISVSEDQRRSTEELSNSDEQNEDRKENGRSPSLQQKISSNRVESDENVCLNNLQVGTEKTTPLKDDKVINEVDPSIDFCDAAELSDSATNSLENSSLKIINKPHENVSPNKPPSPLKDTDIIEQEGSEQIGELVCSAERTSQAIHISPNKAPETSSDGLQESDNSQVEENELHQNESDDSSDEADENCRYPKMQKLDASDEYEFDIPSDEEDVEQTQKGMLENVDSNESNLREEVDRASSPLKQKLIDNDQDIASKNVKPLEISENRDLYAEASNNTPEYKSGKEIDHQNIEKIDDNIKIAPQNESLEISSAQLIDHFESDNIGVNTAIEPLKEINGDNDTTERKTDEFDETQNSQEEFQTEFTHVSASENNHQQNLKNIEINKEASVSNLQFIKNNINGMENDNTVTTEMEKDDAATEDVEEMVNDFKNIIKDDKEQNTAKRRNKEKSKERKKCTAVSENDLDIANKINQNKETDEGIVIHNAKEFLQESVEYTNKKESENSVESSKSDDSVKMGNKRRNKPNKKKIDVDETTKKYNDNEELEVVKESSDFECNKETEQSLIKDSAKAKVETKIANSSIVESSVVSNYTEINILEHSERENVDMSIKIVETDKIANVKSPVKKSIKSKKATYLVETEDDEVEIEIESEKSKHAVKKDTTGNDNIDIEVATSKPIKNKKLLNLENFAQAALDKYLFKKISELDNKNQTSDKTSNGQEGSDQEGEESDSEESDQDQESDQEENEFISTMAEEGEEDTPSEGSNDIIDEGESINSTESEVDSDDEYDPNDSFICDDEAGELLPGDEYDLGDEKKQKKSRIIHIDDCDDDIIKIKRKEKPDIKNKKSRIITIVDSSDSEEDELVVKDNEHIENVKPILHSVDQSTNPKNESVKIQDEEVVILEEAEDTSPVLSEACANTAETIENEDHSRKSKRKSSITIHENINVKEIKDAALSERISSLVDTFCTSIQRGEISMNLSLEYAIKDSSEGSPQACKEIVEEIRQKTVKTPKRRSKSTSLSDETFEADGKHTISKVLRKKFKKDKTVDKNNVSLEGDGAQDSSPERADRLSVTLDNMEESDKTEKVSKKRRLSKSLDSLSQVLPEKKSKREKKWKKELVTKKKKSPVKSKISKKQSSSSKDSLMAQTYSIMNQLITDVKNRPVRTIVPSKAQSDMNSSWRTEVANVKPSTTIITQRERTEHKLSTKIHPKDFRSQMLSDSSRVKRVDTKKLLRKKGVY